MKNPAPIVLIVFNRPDHTAQVVEALSQNHLASESLLYVFSDAPRNNKDLAAVSAVRTVLKNMKGFKEVLIHEHANNQGCSQNVLTSIESVLNQHERCIVVEDDVLVSPLFLQYMNNALDLYEGDETIFCIGAYHTAFRLPSSYREETFLLNRACSWGWATWRSAWKKISVDGDVMRKELADPAIRKAFARSGKDLLRTFQKVPDIWDLRVTYGLWKCGLHGLFPVENLTANIGQDGSGTNYNGSAKNNYEEIRFPKALPELKHLKQVDPVVAEAFWKSTGKPVWRLAAINTAKALGIYDFLLRKFGK